MKRVILTVPFLVYALAPLASAQDLPDGKGKDTVENVCGSCHGVDLISGQRATKEGWGYIVDDMVSRGASATNDQIQTIKDYLAKNFGQVNANKGSATELAQVLEITPDQADAIVKYRTDHGPFKTLDDIKKVPALAAVNMDAKKDRLVY